MKEITMIIAPDSKNMLVRGRTPLTRKDRECLSWALGLFGYSEEEYLAGRRLNLHGDILMKAHRDGRKSVELCSEVLNRFLLDLARRELAEHWADIEGEVNELVGPLFAYTVSYDEEAALLAIECNTDMVADFCDRHNLESDWDEEADVWTLTSLDEVD